MQIRLKIRALLRHIGSSATIRPPGMRFLATFLLMMSLLAMSVTVAGADITRPPCSAQIRADNLCYAAALPGSKAETVKKPGACFVCLLPVQDATGPQQPESRLHPAFAAPSPTAIRWTVPWRPPRG